MTWWEIRMWAEGLNEEFRNPEEQDDDFGPPPGAKQYDDVAALGFSVTELK